MAATVETIPAIPLRSPKGEFRNTAYIDFSVEDKLDTDRFNQVLWNGLKGPTEPYPSDRDGRDLRKNRPALLRESKSKNQ